MFQAHMNIHISNLTISDFIPTPRTPDFSSYHSFPILNTEFLKSLSADWQSDLSLQEQGRRMEKKIPEMMVSTLRQSLLCSQKHTEYEMQILKNVTQEQSLCLEFYSQHLGKVRNGLSTIKMLPPKTVAAQMVRLGIKFQLLKDLCKNNYQNVFNMLTYVSIEIHTIIIYQCFCTYVFLFLKKIKRKYIWS